MISDITKYFPFLKKENINQKGYNEFTIPESIQGKINSSKFKFKDLDNLQNLPEEKKKLYEVAVEFQSLFVKMMLNSMKNTINKENDILYGGKVEDIFEDMLYDEYAKIYSRNANLPLAKEIYIQLEKFIPDNTSINQKLSELKQNLNHQKNYIKKIEGLISTQEIQNEWYK